MTSYSVKIDPDLKDIVPGFLQNRKNDLALFRGALATSNAEALRNLGHKMRGSSAGYGFQQLSDWGGQIEDLAEKNELGKISALVDSIEDFLKNVQLT